MSKWLWISSWVWGEYIVSYLKLALGYNIKLPILGNEKSVNREVSCAWNIHLSCQHPSEKSSSLQHTRVESNGKWIPKWKSERVLKCSLQSSVQSLHSSHLLRTFVWLTYGNLHLSARDCWLIPSLGKESICSGTRVLSLSLCVWRLENWIILWLWSLSSIS